MDTVNITPKCSVLYKHIMFVFESEFYLSDLPNDLRLAMLKSELVTINYQLRLVDMDELCN